MNSHPATAMVFPESPFGQGILAPQVLTASDGDTTPLMEAAAAGDFEEVRRLVRAGADISQVDSTGRTAPWYAVFWGQLEVFRYFSGHPDFSKTINLKDTVFGTSMLHAAVQQFDTEFVEILLNAGVDVNAMNNRGETAFDICKDLVTTGCEALPEN